MSEATTNAELVQDIALDKIASNVRSVEQWWSKVNSRGSPSQEDYDVLLMCIESMRARADEVSNRIRALETTAIPF